MKFRNYFPELNDNQLKMLEQKMLEAVGKKRNGAYRQNRYLPPYLVGAEVNDPEHVKMMKSWKAGYNCKIDELREKVSELFGESK